MNIIIKGGLGVSREAWQQLLDDVLVLNLLVAFKLSKPLVQMTQQGMELKWVFEVSVTKLREGIVQDGTSQMRYVVEYMP